jgi:hypothetical protein
MLTPHEPIDSNGKNSASELGDALWHMTEAASQVATRNLETLRAFKIYYSINQNEMAIQAAGVGLSAYAGAMAFEEVALATGTVVVCANPAIALTAGAVAFFCGIKFFKKNKERLANKRRMHYHAKREYFPLIATICSLNPKTNTSSKPVRPMIVQASYITFYTNRFLQWVHVTNQTQPRSIDFVDNEARENWRDFITEVHQNLRQPITNRHLSAAYVQEFLRQQVRSLMNLWTDLLDEKTKAFGDSEVRRVHGDRGVRAIGM